MELNYWVSWAFNNQNLPSWGQAIGSIVAIYVSVKISNREMRHALGEKRKSFIAIVDSVRDFSANVRKVVCLTNVEDQTVSPEIPDEWQVEAYLDALRSILASEVKSPEGVKSLLLMQRQLTLLKNHIGKLILNANKDASYDYVLVDCRERGDNVTLHEQLKIILGCKVQNTLASLDQIDEQCKLFVRSQSM